MGANLPTILKSLNKRPIIVASLGSNTNLIRYARQSYKSGADLLELRIDTFKPQDRKKLLSLLEDIKTVCPLPIIATVRSAREQGIHSFPNAPKEKERTQIYQMAMPYIDMIDLELSSLPAFCSTLNFARKLRKKIILSYHNFRTVPAPSQLAFLVKKFKHFSGDILKIAATAKNQSELANFFFSCASLKNIDRTFIVMGEQGKIFRVAGFSFGSCLTYGYVNHITAPGQISIAELAVYCKQFYPHVNKPK